MSHIHINPLELLRYNNGAVQRERPPKWRRFFSANHGGTDLERNPTTLPFELVEEILCRLPVKLLLQLQCLCKSWKSLVSNRKFAKKHLQMSQICQRHHHLLLSTRSQSEKFYTEVQEIILARYNKTFEWSLKAKMMGMKAIEAAKVFVEETGISDSLSAEQFLVEREDMLRSLFPTSELMPGVSRLLKHLHAKGIPIVVATGSHKRHFELKTQRHGEMFFLMHHVVLGDDLEVKQGKPSPDVFLAAAKRFEGGPVDPNNILVFEDAPSGVQAAKNAGMSVVMVPDPRLDKSFHGAGDQILKSLLDFNPSKWGLPPFEDNES